MLFSVEYDTGSSIKAYLIPDSGGLASVVTIRGRGADLLTLSATDERPEIVASGRHASGMCGFTITETHIPDLAGYLDLEIVEASSGVMIYRRAMPSFIEAKVFRLETHLLPLWRVDDALKARFQFWYKGVDRHGRETATQAFCVHKANSAYISGRLFFANIQFYLSQGFKTVTMFREPFDELAERLIVLKNVGEQAAELLGPRDALTYETVIQALAEVDTFDYQSCRRFFKRADETMFAALNNPLVRQLTSNSFEEIPTKACISTALQILSDFQVLSLRSDAGHFSEGLAEMLDLGGESIPTMKEFKRVSELGAVLREIKDAELMLEYDLELYDHTSRAFGTLASQVQG